MPTPSLNASNKPSWRARLTRGIAAAIHPEIYEQEQGGIVMSQYGIVKRVQTKSGVSQFGEINGGNQFVIERPGAGIPVDPARALDSFKGFVYAAVNAKAREVMTIDWRLFSVDGDDTKEETDHDLLDLLDSPNDNMNGLELKYLTSACLDLTGNCYWWLEGVSGELDQPKAIHLMAPDRVRPVIDSRSWPHQLIGYKMKLATTEMAFKPYEVVQFRLPNPSNFFEGYSPVMAGAEYIDNDNYAMEFNRKFFRNGARPAGFLESDFIAETQLEALKIGFTDMHAGIDNMNRIGVLPKGVKWNASGSNPKDMDFKNMSVEMRDRVLSMFGVSKTILGTAESDTNRATAETADYVFSKRVVKPHMIGICGTLNDRLVGRYGDNLYASFIDPVPEDKAFRIQEMTAMMGGQPVMAANEARDNYAGLGPVDGGDTLMKPTAMGPVGDTTGTGNKTPQPEDDPNAKAVRKTMNRAKAANGLPVGYRPSRSKFQKLAAKRSVQAKSLAEKIAADLKAKLEVKTKKFATTKSQDEDTYKAFSEYTRAAEKDIAATVKKLNGEQKAEVLANLPAATKKAINPADLFDIDKWISITTDALTPIMDTLFEHQARAAVAELGVPEFNPFNDTARAAVKRSVQLMSQSYNQTTLEALESQINDGLAAGEPLADITKRVEQVYDWSDESRAAMVAKTESFRTANDALKTAWQQSGVVKTVRWYTTEKDNVCQFCQELDGRTASIDDNFFNNGDSLTVGEGDSAQTLSFDYGDVSAPPCHPNCSCFIRPDQISID